MRQGGFRQRIARRNRHANFAVAEVTIELVELTRTRNRIEGTHAKRAPLHRNRFDAVRVHDASLGPHEVETSLELVASGEREHAIQAIGRECPESIDGFCTPRVDHTMSPELSDEACRRGAGRRGDDVSSALSGELNGHGANRSRRPEDQHGLPGLRSSALMPWSAVNPVAATAPASRKSSLFGTRRHVLSVYYDELCVEATLAIAELVCVDAVTELNAPDSCASGHDDPRAVNLRHQRESRSTRLSP